MQGGLTTYILSHQDLEDYKVDNDYFGSLTKVKSQILHQLSLQKSEVSGTKDFL